jgi:hypothetical protein
MLGDACQHPRSDLFIVMECKDKVCIAGASQGAMGA